MAGRYHNRATKMNINFTSFSHKKLSNPCCLYDNNAAWEAAGKTSTILGNIARQREREEEQEDEKKTHTHTHKGKCLCPVLWTNGFSSALLFSRRSVPGRPGSQTQWLQPQRVVGAAGRAAKGHSAFSKTLALPVVTLVTGGLGRCAYAASAAQ